MAALALLSAGAVVTWGSTERHGQEKASAQLASREHDGAEVTRPQQAPVARQAGRSGLGLRSKPPAKKKPLALASASLPRLASRARVRLHVYCARQEIGFLLLRTQNPRAPPFT